MYVSFFVCVVFFLVFFHFVVTVDLTSQEYSLHNMFSPLFKSSRIQMHDLVELWHCSFYSLVKCLTKSDAVNDQQMWDYSTLEIGNRGSKTGARPPPPTPFPLPQPPLVKQGLAVRYVQTELTQLSLSIKVSEFGFEF